MSEEKRIYPIDAKVPRATISLLRHDDWISEYATGNIKSALVEYGQMWGVLTIHLCICHLGDRKAATAHPSCHTRNGSRLAWLRTKRFH